MSLEGGEIMYDRVDDLKRLARAAAAGAMNQSPVQLKHLVESLRTALADPRTSPEDKAELQLDFDKIAKLPTEPRGFLGGGTTQQ